MTKGAHKEEKKEGYKKREVKAGKNEVLVSFEYQQHSEAYYHSIKMFLANLLDGEE
jgi:hypothetical protein